MNATERVEQMAIAAAEAYARANGYTGDRRAAGLVLAGMVIGARTTVEAQQLLARGYLEAHPSAAVALLGWARVLANVAETP